jgi:hypothetical protein
VSGARLTGENGGRALNPANTDKDAIQTQRMPISFRIIAGNRPFQ